MHDPLLDTAQYNGKTHDGWMLVKFSEVVWSERINGRRGEKDRREVSLSFMPQPLEKGVLSTYITGTYTIPQMGSGLTMAPFDMGLVFPTKIEADKYLQSLRLYTGNRWFLVMHTDELREWERVRYLKRARQRAKKVGKSSTAKS